MRIPEKLRVDGCLGARWDFGLAEEACRHRSSSSTVLTRTRIDFHLDDHKVASPEPFKTKIPQPNWLQWSLFKWSLRVPRMKFGKIYYEDVAIISTVWVRR